MPSHYLTIIHPSVVKGTKPKHYNNDSMSNMIKCSKESNKRMTKDALKSNSDVNNTKKITG